MASAEIPSSCTLEVPRDDAERDALARFHDAISKENASSTSVVDVTPAMAANGGVDGVLLRFLRARKHDVSQALEMLRRTLAWRAAEDVDAVLDEPVDIEEFRTLGRLYPASYHGRDVNGRCVYMERTGAARFVEVLDLLGEDGFVKMHLRAMEYQARVLLPKSSEDLGVPITQTCNVIDVGELSLYDTVSHSGVLSALRRVAAIDQDYYPENLGVTLVCNAPWSFRAAWAVVRHFLAGYVPYVCLIHSTKSYAPQLVWYRRLSPTNS